MVYTAFDRIGDWLLPPRCLLCHGPGSVRGRDLCAPCEADLPWLRAPCHRCGLPGPPMPGPATPRDGCARCCDRPLPYRRCHAPFLYVFPLTELVPALKYQGALATARVLGTLQAESVVRAGLQRDVDVLVPLPLHASRLVERGFNQSLELSRVAAAATGIELDDRTLHRSRSTAPQVGLPRDARSANVRGAFTANPSRLKHRRVALVDDVVTTGATVAEAAHALLDAGARSVDVWCIARAPG